MGIKDILKKKSKEIVNIASEGATKIFDYPKIKSVQLKELISFKIEKKQLSQLKQGLLKIIKLLMILLMKN